MDRGDVGKEVYALVCPRWLNQQVEQNSSRNLIVLESCFLLPDQDWKKYLSGHIVGAHYFNLRELCDENEFIPWPLPESQRFIDKVHELGIDLDSHVVIYSRTFISYSARLWCIFKAYGFKKVSVLNGGYEQWVTDGYKTEISIPSIPTMRSNINLAMKNNFFLKYEDLLKILKESGKFQIVDVRRSQHFNGLEKEPNSEIAPFYSTIGYWPKHPLKPGHMPKAKNVFYGELLYPDGLRFKTKEEIRQVLGSSGVDINQPMITTCYLGLTACFIPLLLHDLVDSADIRVYIGSWTEFGQLAPANVVVRD